MTILYAQVHKMEDFVTFLIEWAHQSSATMCPNVSLPLSLGSTCDPCFVWRGRTTIPAREQQGQRRKQNGVYREISNVTQSFKNDLMPQFSRSQLLKFSLAMQTCSKNLTTVFVIFSLLICFVSQLPDAGDCETFFCWDVLKPKAAVGWH